MSCACSLAKAFSNYLCRLPDIAAVETIFSVFSYDGVSGRDSNLSPPDDEQMRYVLSHCREFMKGIDIYRIFIILIMLEWIFQIFWQCAISHGNLKCIDFVK